MEKLTSKGKHTVKVRNYPHKNMIYKQVIMRGAEYKCRLFEMHLKLRNQQLKTIMYVYRPLYQNLMVTENQKSIIDIHTRRKTQTKKKSKHNTKDSHQITSEENKREKEEKRPTKTNPKQLTKWQ